MIRNELNKYSTKLAEKPEIIVANKMDLTDSEKAFEAFQETIQKKAFAISAVSGKGIPQMLDYLWKEIQVQKEMELSEKNVDDIEESSVHD
jgi:GTP-binding protein